VQLGANPRTGSSTRIYLMRNGEPCDRITSAWSNKAFRDKNAYRQIDLNQPPTTVNRAAGNEKAQAADLFKYDAPVTQIGSMSGKYIGRAFRMRDINVRSVICSPALRCVQTASAVISEMKMKHEPPICIEPGFVDPLVFYWKERLYLPKFLNVEKYKANGYNVDTKYEQLYNIEGLKKMHSEFKEEEPLAFYQRINQVMGTIIERFKYNEEGDILIVCHAPTIDAIVRYLMDRGDLPHRKYDLYRMGLFYPFCSVTTLEQTEEASAADGRLKWELKLEAIPSITYAHISTTSYVPFFPPEAPAK